MAATDTVVPPLPEGFEDAPTETPALPEGFEDVPALPEGFSDVGTSGKTALDSIISNTVDFGKSAAAQTAKSTFTGYAGLQRMGEAIGMNHVVSNLTEEQNRAAQSATIEWMRDRSNPEKFAKYKAAQAALINAQKEIRAQPLDIGVEKTTELADRSFSDFGADPESKSAGSQIGRGAGRVIAAVPVAAGTGGAGIFAGGAQAGAEAYQEAFTAKDAELRQAGETDDAKIREESEKAASTAALKTAPWMASYLVGGKLVSAAVAKLLPATSPILRALAGGAGATAANMTLSGAARAAGAPEGQRLEAAMPTLETGTTDALFGLGMHGLGEYQGAKAATEHANNVLSGKDEMAGELALRSTDQFRSEAERTAADTALSKMMEEARKVVGRAGEAKATELEAAGLPQTAEVLRQKAAEAAKPAPAAKPAEAEPSPLPTVEPVVDDPLHSAESDFLANKPPVSDSAASSEPAKSDVGQELPAAPTVVPADGQELPIGIAGPALVDSKGSVLASGDAGVTHASMMKPAMEKLLENPEGDPTDIQHAFLDGAGKVLSREDAYDVAEKGGQLNEAGVAKRARAEKAGKRPQLESQDLTAKANAPEPAPAPEPITPPEDAVADGIVDVPAQVIPADQIAVRPDLMQFKRADDTKSGVNEAERITGTWDDLKAGTMLLWEPADPSAHGLEGDQRYVVANGHHRFEFGSREGVKGYNTQIIREVDGFSANDARRIGAEINIADNKGTIYDQAKFLRNLRDTHGENEAVAVGRRIGARGRKAADIAFSAGDTLFGSFINEKVTPDAAAKIASAAPGNDAAQVAGIRALNEAGKSADWAANIARAHDVLAPAEGTKQVNLFGEAEFADIDAIAGRATAIQAELREMIRSVQNASNNPKMAAKMGVDVKDPAGVQKRIEQMRGEIERWNHWPTDPDLMAKLKAGTEKDTAVPEPGPKLTETAAKIIQPDPEMFTGKADDPFNLVGETKAEQAARIKAEDERQARIAEADAAQAKEENDRNQGDMFASKSEDIPTPEREFLGKIDEALGKAPNELDLLRSGKKPEQLTFTRPGGGTVTVLNTRAALAGLRSRLAPVRETGHLANIVRAAHDLASQFKGVRVRVLRDESELPEGLRGKVGPNHEEIVDVKTGDVYLFSKNLESPERAQEVIWHAVLGHYGVEKVVDGVEWAGIADSVIANHEAVARGLGRLYVKESDPSKWTQDQRNLVAREFIARLAEKPQMAPTIWNRVVTAVKDGLRALGVKVSYSDADFDRILRKALKKVDRPGGEGEGVFASIARPSWRGLRDELLDIKRFGPFERAKNRLAARGQRTYLEAQRLVTETNRAIPDPVRREAIGTYIEAAGEATRTGETRQEVLDRWATTNRATRYQPGYDAARALTRAEQAFADRVSRFYDTKAGTLRGWGILENVLDAYVSRLWNIPREGGGPMTGGRMKVNPSFARHRQIASAFEGEQPTVDPHTGRTVPGLEHITKDIGERMAIYSIEANKTLAHRQFIADMSRVRAQDGRPAVAPTGMMRVAEGPDGSPESYLAYPDAKLSVRTGTDIHGDPIEEPTRDYRVIKNKWLMKGWKWLGQDENGAPILMQSDLSVHPDYYRDVNNVTRGSSIREWMNSESGSNAEAYLKLGLRGIETAQSLVKEAMFSLSGFHYATIAEHVAEHRVNPLGEMGKSFLNIVTQPLRPLHDIVTRSFDMRPPDYSNPATAEWMRHGLMVAPDHASPAQFMEGVGGASGINRLASQVNDYVRRLGPRGYAIRPITETAALMGRAARAISDDLFHRFIPALKLRLADTVYQRNLHIYAPDIASGRVSRASVRYLTAQQVNAATSHLNLVDLGRNPTLQHFLSLTVLAPDFTESRGRFVAQAAKGLVSRSGREQMLAIAIGSGVLISTLRVLNQIIDGDPHWELKNLFALIHGNRRYEVRSVQGDVIKAVEDHNAFVQGRVSPLAKFGTELYTGTNYRGEPVTKLDALGELLTAFIPISARSVPGLRQLNETTRNNPVSPLEQFAGTMGIHSSRYSPISETYRLARSYKDANKLGGAPGVYPVSPYQQLRYALEDNDSERAQVEFEKLRAKGQTSDAIERGFKESMSHPFTDTKAHDEEFAKSLDDHDRGIYRLALKRREDILAHFHRLPRR